MLGWYILWNVFAGCLIGLAVGAVLNVFVLAYFVFTLAQDERHHRNVELMEKMIELEKLKEPAEAANDEHGGASNEPQVDPRLSIPDGAGDSGDGEGLPVRTGAPGCLRDVLSDLPAGIGELRDAGGQDAEAVEAVA